MTLMKCLQTACAVAALVSFAGAAEARHCSRVGGEGTAITSLLAGENAKVALADAISGSGGKARGKMVMHCKYEFIVSTCTASQRVCK